MLFLLAAAILVGVAFNAANPLGVRRVAHDIDKAALAVPAPSSAVKPIYQNETASLSLEMDGSQAAVAAATAPAPQPPIIAPNAAALTWPQTKALLDAGRIILVDARDAVYYQTGHIPGAISLPAAGSGAEFQDFAAKFSKDASMVVYCGSAQCPLANAVVARLRDQYGFTNVREMPGGYVEYRQAQANADKGGRQ
jgi:rhodanese-related sulfurtransferase